jgi:hypothetical protein
LRVCLWNIHGAAITKLETHEHLLDLFQHVDVIALTETHHFPGDTFAVLLGFCCFDVARPVTPQGVIQKQTGGIAVLVRETWANSTVVWKTTKDGTRIWLRLGNAFQRPLFLCIVYVAPQGLPYVDNNLFDHICQDVATPLWPSVGVKPNTWKSWELESSGTPECSELHSKGQNTLHLGCSWCHWKDLET